jgi:hypothetical protein
MRMLAAIAALFIHFAAQATSPPPPPPAPPSPPAKIESMAWLAGYWEGEGLGGRMEDIWMPPRDGVILGAFRLVQPQGKGFYELFAIEEDAGSLRFVVKHFHRNWVGWEEKDVAVKMPLVSISENAASFGGVGFRREGADQLVVELVMRLKDGTTRTEVLKFRRRPL